MHSFDIIVLLRPLIGRRPGRGYLFQLFLQEIPCFWLISPVLLYSCRPYRVKNLINIRLYLLKIRFVTVAFLLQPFPCKLTGRNFLLKKITYLHFPSFSASFKFCRFHVYLYRFVLYVLIIYSSLFYVNINFIFIELN